MVRVEWTDIPASARGPRSVLDQAGEVGPRGDGPEVGGGGGHSSPPAAAPSVPGLLCVSLPCDWIESFSASDWDAKSAPGRSGTVPVRPGSSRFGSGGAPATCAEAGSYPAWGRSPVPAV